MDCEDVLCSRCLHRINHLKDLAFRGMQILCIACYDDLKGKEIEARG